eukprot:gene2973-3426_t
MTSEFDPPKCVSGMTSLDKSAFERKIIIPALKELNDLTGEERRIVEETKAVFISYEFLCTYEYYTADQVLHAVMPNEIEVTTAFETIGHIAHLNLRDSQLPYKNIIGQVILDKNPCIKTVVNKTNSIDEVFRFFRMELIAGEEKMYASLKEHDCRFEFDFSKVYWNSRLQTEHKRIIDMLSGEDIVCDVFAGVGPFAIPAAKKGCKVYANDLNPESYKALMHNAKINKVEKNLFAYNMDGRDFLRDFFVNKSRNELDALKAKENQPKLHVIMNLPAIAVEFLDVFRELLEMSIPVKSTKIYCYCFTKSETPSEHAREKVEEILKMKLPDAEVHDVRNVAPKKSMMCVTFELNFKSINKLVHNGTGQKDMENRGTKRTIDEAL